MVLFLLTTPPTPEIQEWLAYPVFGNPVVAWLIAIAIALGILLALALIRRILLHRLKALAEKTVSRLDDLGVAVLADIRWWAVFVVVVCTGATVLTLPEIVLRGI